MENYRRHCYTYTQSTFAKRMGLCRILLCHDRSDIFTHCSQGFACRNIAVDIIISNICRILAFQTMTEKLFPTKLNWHEK